MNQQEIERLEKIVDAATEGPWNHDDQHTYINTPNKRLLSFWENSPQITADLNFIAESRTALPALIQAWREQQSEIAYFKKRLDISLEHESNLTKENSKLKKHVNSACMVKNPDLTERLANYEEENSRLRLALEKCKEQRDSAQVRDNYAQRINWNKNIDAILKGEANG